MERAILGDIFSFVAAVVGMGCLTGVLITWIKWRGGRQKAAPELLARLDEIGDRIGRLDTAIDTMAIEVERISEAQRFTSRVLAERAGASSLPETTRAPGSNSSH